ncbi:MAG: glycosyltransferase family 39 protein [Clostridia bacterium]|nr:glycosyltransferase family 39 protein [Clostridia bacterium]MBN2883688.1 glycosyltransferase family 39 protein [Clostridia bacterium]
MRMKWILEGIKKYKVMVYLVVYFLVNLLFLTKFPFMHSDESWLSGLTQSMMARSPAATESFFDLLPRNPHAIKIIFHGIQVIFDLIFGYNLFVFRLVSLAFGILALFFFQKLAHELTRNESLSFIGMIALSVCIQFIYASHFARQEIIIAAAMLGILYYLIKNHAAWDFRKDILAAVLTGLTIGIHPNSFIIALAVGSVYLFYIAFDRKLKIRNLMIYILITGVFAGIFIGLSYLMDSNFISNYLKYGSELGVTSPVAIKYDGLFNYYSKLFSQTSGTYYTPNIRGELFVFAASAAAVLAAGLKKRENWLILFPLVAVNLGYIVIGRYSQPGIIFIFPFGLMAAIIMISMIDTRKVLVALILCLGLLANSVGNIMPWLNNDYKDYLSEIRENIPDDTKVLANLNTGYLFGEGEFLDYRNLAYLYENNIGFDEYVKSRGIEYIIYPEEMDFIYERRPVWNIVYGNLYPYYEDMTGFLDEQCSLVHEFTSPYGMRIVRFAGDRDWKIRIYRID